MAVEPEQSLKSEILAQGSPPTVLKITDAEVDAELWDIIGKADRGEPIVVSEELKAAIEDRYQQFLAEQKGWENRERAPVVDEDDWNRSDRPADYYLR